MPRLYRGTTKDQNGDSAVRAERSRSMNGSKVSHFDRLSANGAATVVKIITNTINFHVQLLLWLCECILWNPY
jgi:hypothetical protein